MNIERRKVNHPDFYDVHKRGANGLPVIVFQRKEYVEPDSAVVMDYEIRQRIVESLGGRLIHDLHDLSARQLLFTTEDCKQMVQAVRKEFRGEYVVVDHWNGKGCYTFSVSIMPIKQFKKEGRRNLKEAKVGFKS